MDEEFENQIVQMIDNAEKMSRDYELAIKKNKYDTECPYLKIINIYENIKQKLVDRGWNEQASVYNNQIKFYYEKLERDKKLREVELQKKQKQKEYEELHKLNEIESVRATILSLNKEEEILDYEEKRKAKVVESEEIFAIISNAERMAKDYEHGINTRGILQLNCPYQKIIDIYKEAKERLNSIGWEEESHKLMDSISYYNDKLKKDKKLREIERKKIAPYSS
ncbi:MAG: hypothetical protein ACXABO_14540 [Promethearchaeota archaeon]|jgi:hypothetical protein